MSTTRIWRFHALDTFFFRDSSPFNAGEGGYTSVSGSFPPFMSTLQGAIRTALAYGQGWTPEKEESWPWQLGSHEDIGQLVLNGPYIQWNGQTLFPVPLFLMRQRNGQTSQYTRLEPGKEAVLCDLGEKYLPQPVIRIKGAKLMEQAYIDKAGLGRVLNGEYPADDQIKEPEELWQPEYRVGIERNLNTRTAVDAKLYSCVHVRPTRGVALAVSVSGIPADWHDKVNSVFTMGGEGRLARSTIASKQEMLPEIPALKISNDRVRFTLVLVTPAKFAAPHKTREAIINGPPGAPGRCIAGCIGKVRQVGGWDMLKKLPRPLELFVPAGSVWFFEAPAANLEQIKELHGKCLGEKTNYGYGQVVIGKWGD
ncbi:MAG: hypothetical protein M1119_04200 [Firmicutes bacterium]|nr:hypothetical protein [Bacillota bacterium]